MEGDGHMKKIKDFLVLILQATLCSLAIFFFAVSITGAELQAADAGNTIRIGGTGGALGAMQQLSAAFKKTLPDVNVVVLPSLGSGGGIKALLSGTIDIALSSRPLKDSERGQGAVEIEYAKTPFVLATSNKNSMSGFTMAQVVDIYEGKIKTWPNGSLIRLVLRPEGESDTALLKNMSGAMKQAVENALSRKGMILAVTDQDSADAMENIKGALGTSTLSQIISEKRALKALSLDGVKPSAKNIANGTYPHFKTFSMVVVQKPSGLSKQFIDFVRSETGHKILTESGHLTME